MWLRRYSLSMGIDCEEFGKAFLVESIVKKLEEVICASLHFEINKLTEANAQLKSELNNFNAMNAQLIKEVGELRDIEKQKDTKIAKLESKIEWCESKLDDQEQYSRRNSLRFNGIPESDNEDIVVKTIDVINNKVKPEIPITADHVDRIHRVGKRGSTTQRAVLVKFSTYRYRQRVYSNRRNLKTSKEQHETPIFVNEDLTRKRSNLLWKARCLKRDKKIQDCWSSDGTILVKTNEHKIISIGNMVDLDKF